MEKLWYPPPPKNRTHNITKVSVLQKHYCNKIFDDGWESINTFYRQNVKWIFWIRYSLFDRIDI